MGDVAFRPLSELKDLFAQPKVVRDNVRNTVLLFSDQVPFCVKIQTLRHLYARHEVKTKRNRVSIKASEALMQMTGQDPESASSGQKRGGGTSEQDKFRVTLELVQSVHDYFDETKEPRGRIEKSLLVLGGSHARLSNIDDEGRFIKDEAFARKGKKAVRRAGTSARGLMKGFVKLRRESAEVRTVLEKIEVMQQPSAFADSIIVSWHVEAQSERISQAVRQRDLFASAFSEISAE